MVEAKAPAGTKRLIIALVLSMIFALTTLGAGIYLKAGSEDQLRAGLIEGCQKNGNPLRKIVRVILRNEIDKTRDEIAQSKAANIREFFPQIPPEKLRVLLRAQNEKRHQQNDVRRAQIVELHPIDCDAQYKD